MSDSSSSVFDDLKAEMEETGQSLKGLIDDVTQRADENDRDVVGQLNAEFESVRSNRARSVLFPRRIVPRGR